MHKMRWNPVLWSPAWSQNCEHRFGVLLLHNIQTTFCAEVPDRIFKDVTYNKHLTQKLRSNHFFKAGFKTLYLTEYHIFHFSPPQLSVTSSATLKDTSTMEEFSQAIQIYIWFPPTIFF